MRRRIPDQERLPVRRRSRPAAWMISLPDYLGRIPVEMAETDHDRCLIDRTLDAIMKTPRETFEATLHPWRSDLRFLVRYPGPREMIGALLVEDVASNTAIGGVLHGLPVLLPSFRGRGIGAEIVCLSDSRNSFALRPGRYSIEGFRARCSAHRLQVERAHQLAPETVTTAALSWYDCRPDGTLVLNQPWRPETHNAWLQGP